MSSRLHLLVPVALVSFLAVARVSAAQDPAEIERLFEAGRYQEVTAAWSPSAPPPVIFLAGQSFQKQNANGQAAEAYQALAALPDSNAWHFVGLSATRLLEGDADGALGNAQKAAELGGDLTEAHFQLGLVRSRRSEWALAAQAFDRAAEIDGGYAYAHYYGGLAHYRANRPDRMATHFEQFLRAAPEAPERPEVTQLMRTVRGR